MVFHVAIPCKPCDSHMHGLAKVTFFSVYKGLRALKFVVIIVYKPLVIRDLINIMDNIKEAIPDGKMERASGIVDKYNIRIIDYITWEETLFRSRDMGRAVAVRRWTPTAVECYKRGCNCEGCWYSEFFSGTYQKCQMKASVLELVRVIGTPDVDLPQLIDD